MRGRPGSRAQSRSKSTGCSFQSFALAVSIQRTWRPIIRACGAYDTQDGVGMTRSP